MVEGFARPVRRLRRELRAHRMDPLATVLEDGRHRTLREPVDLDVRTKLAKFVGDRYVPLGVAEPDRRRDVQSSPPPRHVAGPGGARGDRRHDRAHGCDPMLRTKSRIARFTSTGQRSCGAWPPPATVMSGAPSSAASRSPTASELSRSSAPWITRAGQRTRLANGMARPSKGSRGPHSGGGQRYGPG